MACETCHERKVKCDGAKPTCGNCKLRNTECRYKQRKAAPPPLAKRTGQYRERLERLERLWDFHGGPSSPMPAYISSTFRVLPGTRHEYHRNCFLPPANISQNTGLVPDTLNPTHSMGFSNPTLGPTDRHPSAHEESHSASENPMNASMEELLGEPPSTRILFEFSSFMTATEGYYDCTGPSSGLSPFMTYDLGSASGNIGTEFRSNSLKEEMNLCQEALLKMTKGIQRVIEVSTADMSLSSQSIKPLPPPAIADEYLSLYLMIWQRHFPIVRREHLAAANQENQEASRLDNVSWYTLYNAVLAMGSFLKLSGHSYKSAKEECWGYFNNAFNMQPHLLPGRTNLMAVQGFCVLCMVADHIGTPSLVQRCAAFAATLAVGLGMHRAVKPNENSDSDQESINDRELIFWIAYFFDKNFSYQMGRPSIIDDEEISCPFPSSITAQSTEFGPSIEFVLHLVRFAYLSSKIRKNLYSAAALTRDSKDLLPIRDSLARDVAIWRKRIPPGYHAEDHPFRVASLAPQVRPCWAVLVRIVHADLICSIHKSFAYPLVRHPTMKLDDIESQNSEFEYLQAARELILLLGSLEMEADAPNWFFVYHLLKAVVPIFIHVITNPLKPSTKNDIALMNVASGIFGGLEFATAGDLTFPGVSEFPQLAKAVVEKARVLYNCSSEPIAEPVRLGQGSLMRVSSSRKVVANPSDSESAFILQDFDGSGNMDEFSMEVYSHLQESGGPFGDLSENFTMETYEAFTI